MAVVVLATITINSRSTSNHAFRVQSDAPAESRPTQTEYVEAPDSPSNISAAEPETIEQPSEESIVAAELAPLASENIVTENASIFVAAPTVEPSRLVLPAFEAGSSRADVIAAQGSLPTYAAHHDSTLW